MHKASAVIAAGADFKFLGYESTALKSSKPVISICAGDGCRQEPDNPRVSEILRGREKGSRPPPHALRAPRGPDLAEVHIRRPDSKVIEEREEYEPTSTAEDRVRGSDYGEI